MDRISIIVTLVSANAVLIRLFREDVRFWPSIKAPWRDIIVAAATLLIAPTLDMLTQGTAFGTAALTAFLAALPSLLTLIASLFATKQSDLQIVAQKVANVDASMKPATPPMFPCLTLCLVFAAGCAGSFEEVRHAENVHRLGASPIAPPSARCISLDTQHRNWSNVGAGSAVLAGAAGITAIPMPQEARPWVIGGAVGFAALAAYSTIAAAGTAETWARECSQ